MEQSFGEAISPVRRAARTYVLQVLGGREQYALSLIERIVPEELYEEVFLPQYDRRIKRQGEWRTERELLVPGYLYLRTCDIDQVRDRLREVPTLTRILGNEDQYVPLDAEEVAWLERMCNPETHTVEVSLGVIEGDRVIITAGPLQGYEAQIERINRHKRTAEVRFRILGREKLIKLGLEIVSKTTK